MVRHSGGQAGKRATNGTSRQGRDPRQQKDTVPCRRHRSSSGSAPAWCGSGGGGGAGQAARASGCGPAGGPSQRGDQPAPARWRHAAGAPERRHGQRQEQGRQGRRQGRREPRARRRAGSWACAAWSSTAQTRGARWGRCGLGAAGRRRCMARFAPAPPAACAASPHSAACDSLKTLKSCCRKWWATALWRSLWAST